MSSLEGKFISLCVQLILGISNFHNSIGKLWSKLVQLKLKGFKA
jgi:hypothetical protein